MLDVIDVSVRANDKSLLTSISAKVGQGEVFFIIGPNGSGKSTLLKAVAGDVPLFSGEVTLCRQAVSSWQPQLRARHLAILPQLSLLNFPYTVTEVVALGRTPHLTGISIDTDIVHETMDAMDLSDLSQRKYTELSGGERQRTQLARVLAQIWREEDAKSRLLMLDEPCSALDLGHQQQLMKTLMELAKQGVAIVIVAHDINLAARYAHSMLALKNGTALACGTADKILNEQLLQTLYDARLQLVEHSGLNQTIVVQV